MRFERFVERRSAREQAASFRCVWAGRQLVLRIKGASGPAPLTLIREELGKMPDGGTGNMVPGMFDCWEVVFDKENSSLYNG